MPAAIAASARARAAGPPTANRRLRPAAAAARPHASCMRDRVIAELEHLSEHRNRSRVARFMRDHFKRAAERGRARVVGVVDQRDVAAKQPDGASPIGRLKARRSRWRCRRDRCRTRAQRPSRPARSSGCRVRGARFRSSVRRPVSRCRRSCRECRDRGCRAREPLRHRASPNVRTFPGNRAARDITR